MAGVKVFPEGSQPPKGVLVLISQVFVPDPAAVGQQLADVARAMADRGWRVIVYTSDRGYEDAGRRYPRREVIGNLEVYRLRWSSFGKQTLAARLIGGASFLIQAVGRAIAIPGLSQMLVSTSPPFAGLAGLLVNSLRGVSYTWWVMDLNPDQLVALGSLTKKSLFVRAFNWLNAITMKRARCIIVLDRYMRARLADKYGPSDKVCIVPPWPHGAARSTTEKAGLAFRMQHRLQNTFIIMYAGNHALQHPLATLLHAAEKLESRQGIRFVFIGGGFGKVAVEKAIAAGRSNLLSLPYQPLNGLEDTLAAADLHVVSMGNDLVGIVHPCKVYGALAAARPILFFGPEKSHVGDLLASARIGRRVEHGDTAAAVIAIDELAGLSQSQRVDLGRTGARLIETHFARVNSVNRVCQLLESSAELKP